MDHNELQAALAQEEKRLQAAYYYVGREYVKLLDAGAAPAVPGLSYLLGKAREFQANIDSLHAQLNPPAPPTPVVPAAPEAPAVPVAPAAPVASGNKFCTSCGSPLAPGAAFCTNCGARQ